MKRKQPAACLSAMDLFFRPTTISSKVASSSTLKGCLGPGFPLQQIASIYKPFHTLWINHMLCTEKTNSMTCKSQRTHKALEERRSWSVFFRLHECIHNILTQRQRTELRTWTEVQIPQERPSAVVKRRCNSFLQKHFWDHLGNLPPCKPDLTELK